MKRLVVWGGATGLQSHRHIHRGFYNTARKLGIEAKWVHDEPNGFEFEEGDVVIAADIWGNHLPYSNKASYVMHNFSADHPVIQQADPEQILRLQVWTTDAFGEDWDTYVQYDRPNRILFQPWGTDLLESEFLEPVYNPNSQDIAFVGAVWSDTKPGFELGNKDAIDALFTASMERGLDLRLYTQIPEHEMIQKVRAARLAPTVVGGWQQEHGYLPCRAFKQSSYGVPVISNSGYVNDLFQEPDSQFHMSIAEMIDHGLSLDEENYYALVKSQQEVASRYTYAWSIQNIEAALERGRDGLDGGPFEQWRTHSPIPSYLARDKVDSYRHLLTETKDLLLLLSDEYRNPEDPIDIVRSLEGALGAAIAFVPPESSAGIRTVRERGRDFLRNLSPEVPPDLPRALRTAAARIESALE